MQAHNYTHIDRYICDWICKKGSDTCSYGQYVFEIFNSLQLKNA